MRKPFARAALLAALAIAAAACGGGGGEQPSETAVPVGPTSTVAQAAGDGVIVAAGGSRLGTILVDAEGRTLYAFTRDKGGQSACSGECATNWPALTGAATAGAGARAGLLSTAVQADGSSQVTYGGRPLYYFAGDAKPGDTNGQGVGSVWFAVTADGQLVRAAAAGRYP